ncbi:MAG: response regulator transcription factor, partial [Bacilli bacterium]
MNESILIIEDDPVISHFVEMALKANHYEPLRESSGLEGIATFLRVRPALILLDLGLPDIDGIEALKEIRLASSDVPLLIVSARDKEEEKVKALDLGADDYITKPFGISELLARIRTALRHNNVDATKGSFSYNGLLVDYEKRLV